MGPGRVKNRRKARSQTKEKGKSQQAAWDQQAHLKAGNGNIPLETRCHTPGDPPAEQPIHPSTVSQLQPHCNGVTNCQSAHHEDCKNGKAPYLDGRSQHPQRSNSPRGPAEPPRHLQHKQRTRQRGSVIKDTCTYKCTHRSPRCQTGIGLMVARRKNSSGHNCLILLYPALYIAELLT